MSRTLNCNTGKHTTHSQTKEASMGTEQYPVERRRGATPWPAALVVLAALSLLLAIGCKGRGGGGGGDVMATVNGRKILAGDVEKYYRNQTQGQPEPTVEQAQTLRLSILHQLIDNEILLQKASKLGLLGTDADVDARLNEMKSPFTKEEFDKRLADQGVTLDDLRQDLRRQITVEKVLNKEVTAKIKVSDADVATYYEQHKAEFNLISPQYHLAQILVTTQPSPQVRNLQHDKAQNEAEAIKKVGMLLRKLQSGEDFSKLAMNYSEQPDTAASGGDLGFIPENSLKEDKQAFEAIRVLKPGEHTAALPAGDAQTNQLFGFRILMLIDKEPAGQRQPSDEKVQKSIRDKLTSQRDQLLQSAYLEAMRSQSKIRNYLAEKILKEYGL